MNIIVFPGDGIGPEITAATLKALEALDRRFGLGLSIEVEDVGVARLARDGCTFPDALLEKAREADGIVLGPADTEAYPPPAEGGVNPSSTLRTKLALYGNLRPSYTRDGVPSVAKSMDLLVVRENTEGFYADRNMAQGSGEFAPTDDVALAVRKITAEGARRIAVMAFEQARKRRKHLTVVTKQNVLKLTDGLFLREVDAAAADYPDVTVDRTLVDAMAALLVREPETFDVIVSTNMFGDILSNEAAELSGGLGLAASLNACNAHAMAQASHGSAPEIAGQDTANPAALMLSTAMLLDWLADRHQRNDLGAAAACLTGAVDALLSDAGRRTRDLGGSLGTEAFGAAVVGWIEETN